MSFHLRRRSAKAFALGVSRCALSVAVIWQCGALPVRADDLVRMGGVAVVADTEHRDRWGGDSYQARLACDGSEKTRWISDNWEVTHAIAFLFPRLVKVRALSVTWAHWGSGVMTPGHCLLYGLRQGKWVLLQDLALPGPEPVTRFVGESKELGSVGGLRLVQPPDGARPGSDRRMGVAEIRVEGESIEPVVAEDAASARRAVVAELRDLRRREDDRRVAPQLAVVMRQLKPRGFMGIVDGEDLERGRKNVATRAWARVLADRVIKEADWWVAQSDESIYGLIPEGNPRALCPSFEKGCPIHGGARMTFRATLEDPYRWTCSRGGEIWHDGAVVKHPKTGESVTVRDDGSGWVAPEGFLNPGRRYYFVAAYRYFLLGKLFSSPYEPDGGSRYQGGTPAVQLALAYAFTGEARYAHKAAVMLNRLAEVYRFYDGCVEGPSQRQDGYIGQTFERFLVQNLILACDLIWDEIEKDDALLRFFVARGGADYDGDGKASGADLTYNLQRNLLGYVYEYLHRLMPYFDGDFLMYEMTALSALAKSLGNAELAREMLDSDVGLGVMLNNSWFRDGKFIYDSCGYNVGNAQTPLMIAEWIHGFQSPPQFPSPLDVYNDSRYPVAMLYDFLRYVDCDGRVPMIGDTGATRGRLLQTAVPYNSYDEKALIRLPRRRDYYLRRLLAASEGDLERYRQGRADWWLCFHAEPPEALAASGRVEAPVPTSHLFDDSGIAILRAGADARARQHVCMTFSKGSYGHGHADKLAINLFRFGYDFSADVGYPSTWTDIKCSGWETHTASHCTVMLDEQRQRTSVIGQLHAFVAEAPCDVVEASAEKAYPQASLYRRTVALVRDGEGEPLYTVDLFRVAGAKTRDYLFHSLGRPDDLSITSTGGELTWVKQGRGSLAGPAVAPMSRGGYGFLFDVQRAKGEASFTAAWRPSPDCSQPDRYLLTRRSFAECTVEFRITRTGRASGPRERAVFVFSTAPNAVENRRVIMLPVESLPVGKPVAVKVVVCGAKAHMTLGGRPVGKVDVAGEPGESGSVGLLHYYNYAFDYGDLVITPKDGSPIRVDFSRPLDGAFWARIDETYDAREGVLRARDAEPVAFYVHMLGAPGREIIRASGEGPGVRGASELEGHVVVRDRMADGTRPSYFAGVLEAQKGPSRVAGLAELPVTPKEGVPVSLKVQSTCPAGAARTDILVSALDDRITYTVEAGELSVDFRGRFGLVTLEKGRVVSLMLVGGGHLACGGERVEHAGSLGGEITGVDVPGSAVTIRQDAGGADPSPEMVGRKLLVSNSTYGYPSAYTIEEVERLDGGVWRLRVNLPFVVARGTIGAVDVDSGVFASVTPVMKLRVNPGLFDGKAVRFGPTGGEHRLRTAAESAFRLTGRALPAEMRAGGQYLVIDVGVGDRAAVVSQVARRF
ncbi:MAG: heparinase II/III family protein [Phycisphaerae bacterium]|nr:heparinase II/III family protein [Phycisphaerae bacterium]